MNDGPSVTNVTNLFRKACFWLCSLNYKKPGQSRATKGLLSTDEFESAKNEEIVSSLLVKTRTDSNEEEDDGKDNSKKEIKQLMNSCVQKLMNYLDST